MEKMERLTAINNTRCIHFRPRISSDRYYITIRHGDGCSSYVTSILGYIICLLSNIFLGRTKHRCKYGTYSNITKARVYL